MGKTIEAFYDGKVFHPNDPLKLEPNTHVRITIENIQAISEEKSFLDTAQSLNLEGPPDWSKNFEKYLYDKDFDKE